MSDRFASPPILGLALFASLGLGCAGGSMGRDSAAEDADTIDEGSFDSSESGSASADDGASTDDSASATATATGADTRPGTDDAGTSDGGSADEAATAHAETTTGEDTTSSDPSTTGTTTEGGTTDGTTTTTETGDPDTVDLSGFILLQTASDRELVLPDGTIVPVGGTIVIGRDASQGAFEDFWGVLFTDDVLYIDGADQFPTLNGDETFTLLTPLRTVVDGPTPALVLSTGIERTDATADASDPDAWVSSATPNTDATPGVNAASGGQLGVPYVAEIVDATGAGNYLYEYVEIRVAP